MMYSSSRRVWSTAAVVVGVMLGVSTSGVAAENTIASELAVRQAPAPNTRPGTKSTTDVCMRYGHASVVHENTAYIYGGYLVRNESGLTNIKTSISRNFITLDLSTSFDISNPPFIGRPVPPTNGPPQVAYPVFWHNGDNEKPAFTLYGGLAEDVGDLPAKSTLWSYDVKAGAWSAVETKGDKITRAAEGASTSHKGIGYYRGGHVDEHTEKGFKASRVYLPGMLTFDAASKEIRNTSDTIADVYPTNISPGYQDGVLVPVMLNGRDYLINIGGGADRAVELPMGTAYIYDVADKKWFDQPIKGKAPNGRRSACAVAGTARDGSSVNIFLYGGKEPTGSGEAFTPQGEMWVLSIPSFVWIRVSDGDAGNPPSRDSHQCHLVGQNLVVTGGRVLSDKDKDDFSKCDENAVYVYNTYELAWKTKYDHTKTDYLIPAQIADVIGGNDQGGASWDKAPQIDPNDNESPMLKYVRGKGPGSEESAGRGAAIGGAVGGVAAVVILAGVAWLFYRRRQKKHNYPHELEAPPPPPHDNSNTAHGMSPDYANGQNDGDFPHGPGSYQQMKQRPPSELSGVTSPRYSSLTAQSGTPYTYVGNNQQGSPGWDQSTFNSPNPGGQKSPGLSGAGGHGSWGGVGSPPLNGCESALGDVHEIAEVEGDSRLAAPTGLGVQMPHHGATGTQDRPAELA